MCLFPLGTNPGCLKAKPSLNLPSSVRLAQPQALQFCVHLDELSGREPEVRHHPPLEDRTSKNKFSWPLHRSVSFGLLFLIISRGDPQFENTESSNCSANCFGSSFCKCRFVSTGPHLRKPERWLHASGGGSSIGLQRFPLVLFRETSASPNEGLENGWFSQSCESVPSYVCVH